MTHRGRGAFWIYHSSFRPIGLVIHCEGRLLLVFYSHHRAGVVDVTRPMSSHMRFEDVHSDWGLTHRLRQAYDQK
jgi:hypothetical protein